jgi:energy-coupling factor transporter ATP-binding protein EcfA2
VITIIISFTVTFIYGILLRNLFLTLFAMDFREILRHSGDLGGIRCIQSSPPRSPPPSGKSQTISSLEGLTKPTQGAVPGDTSSLETSSQLVFANIVLHVENPINVQITDDNFADFFQEDSETEPPVELLDENKSLLQCWNKCGYLRAH